MPTGITGITRIQSREICPKKIEITSHNEVLLSFYYNSNSKLERRFVYFLKRDDELLGTQAVFKDKSIFLEGWEVEQSTFLIAKAFYNEDI